MILDLNWRLKASNGITWRLAVIEDMPRLTELWDNMDKRLGKQDRPDLFAMPVVLTLVAEDEHGIIVSGLYGEAVIDFTGIGTDRRAMLTASEIIPTLHEFLLERTIRVVRVLVPKRVAKGMSALLPGLSEITQSFAQFIYQIRL